MKLLRYFCFLGILASLLNSCKDKMSDVQYFGWVERNTSSLVIEKSLGDYFLKVKYFPPEMRTLLDRDNLNKDSLYNIFQKQYLFSITLLNKYGESVFTNLTEIEKIKLEDKITELFKRKVALVIDKEMVDHELFHYEGEVGGRAGVIVHFIFPAETNSIIKLQMDPNIFFSERLFFEFNTANYPKLKIQ